MMSFSLFFDFILGKLVVDQVKAHGVDSDLTSLKSRMSNAESAVNDLTPRMAAVEEAVTVLEPENSIIMRKQFAFYHSSGALSLGDLECGEWVQTGYFPVDWIFGAWSHDGLILHFNNRA